MSVNEQAVPEAVDADQKRLHELGYAQELMRRMSGFSNFAVSFTIISILSGCLTLYGFGMLTGGPVVIVWGWPFVGVMTLFGFAGIYWLVSAKNWFKGPKVQGTAEELAAIERELAS